MWIVEKMYDMDTQERLYNCRQVYPQDLEECESSLSVRANIKYFLRNMETKETRETIDVTELEKLGVVGLTRTDSMSNGHQVMALLPSGILCPERYYRVVAWTDFDARFFNSFKFVGSDSNRGITAVNSHLYNKKAINGIITTLFLGIDGLSMNGIYVQRADDHVNQKMYDTEEKHTLVQYIKHHVKAVNVGDNDVFIIECPKRDYRFKVVDKTVFFRSLSMYKLMLK